MSQIHPTALVSPRACLGKNVSIGPFCVIEDDVVLGDDCRLAAQVTIKQGAKLGPNNVAHERVVLGGEPQYLNAKPPFGDVTIGANNVFRECVTIHRGLKPGHTTTLGESNYLMVNAHVAHDCTVGNYNVIANNSMLGGHVTLENHAYVSAVVGVHQFCRIGSYAMVGGQAHVNKDVPPYVTLDGLTSRIVGLNLIGLKRKGFTPQDIAQLKEAYRVIYRRGLTWAEVLAALGQQFSSGPAAAFGAFFAGGQRGFMPERRTPRAASVKMPHEPTAPEDVPVLRKVA